MICPSEWSRSPTARISRIPISRYDDTEDLDPTQFMEETLL